MVRPDGTSILTDRGRADLISGIRSALGITIPLNSASPTMRDEREHRMMCTLEHLAAEKLSLLLSVSAKSRALSVLEPTISQRLGNHREAEKPFTGEDCYRVRDLLYKGELQNIYVLATGVDLMPNSMTVRAALDVIALVRDEMFDLDSPELVTAHLTFAHSLFKQQRYTPQLMLLVQVHPDKTTAIIDLFQRTNGLPSHRDILTHQGN